MTILCYHAVQCGWESALAVEPADFARQCAWLSRRRTVLPLDVAMERLDRTGRLPAGEAALTFDDGFESLYEQALGTLGRHGLPASVFLVAQTLTQQGQAVDWVDDPAPAPLTTLSRDQVLEMRDVGVDFQSHSYAHLDLTTLDLAECTRDLRDSREFLEDVLSRRVRYLAYPRGRHDARVREAAEAAGYSRAFALPQKAEPLGPYSLPRVGVFRGNSMTTVKTKALRPYLPVRTHRAFPAVQRVVREVGGWARRS